MRINIRLVAAALSLTVAAFVTSCKKESAVEPDTEGKVEAAAIIVGTCTDNADGSPTSTLITKDTTWSGTVTIRGYVRVTRGATLTINPNTVILGECQAVLIIERDGKINAQGTPDLPIRFSSSKPVGSRAVGDWGGVVILGKAPNNQGLNVNIEGIQFTSTDTLGVHGGTDANHNSGVFSYVRIEYAGTQIAEGNEINGLTMGSVGRGTKLDHVQILYAQDDGFEWFGGNVNAKYLYVYGASDDDFDTDFGFTGKIQFAAGVKITSSEPGSRASNGFESDNDATGSGATPLTAPIFANVTLTGSCTTPDAAVWGRGMLVRRNSALKVYNSVISEWTDAVDRSTANAAALLTRISTDATTGTGAGTGCTFLANVLPSDCPRVSNTAPNLTRSPNLGSTVAIGDPFFVNTTYRGAFSSTQADNGGWDLASENANFKWLSFKPLGN